MRPMMRALAVLIAPLSTSCAFLLDFDELEKPVNVAGMGPSGGSSGGGNVGGNAGAGGAAGAACEESCVDTDPCTADECVDGVCQNTRVDGLAPTGFTRRFQFERISGSTLIAGADRYYLALQGVVSNDAIGAIMWSVDPEADEVVEGTNFNAQASGNVTLTPVAMTTSTEDDFRIHTYYPFATGGDGNEVLPLQLLDTMAPDEDARRGSVAIASPMDELRVIPGVGPSADTMLRGEPFAVWPSEAGLTFYHYDEMLQADSIARVATELPVMQLDSVALNTRMAAVFSTQTASRQNQIHVAFVSDSFAGSALLPSACTENGEVTGIDAEWVSTSGDTDLIGLAWSERVLTNFVTHFATVQCTPTSCQPAFTCDDISTGPMVVGLDAEYFRRPEEDGFAYQVALSSVVSEEASAALLSLSRVTIANTESEILGETLVAQSSIDTVRRPLFHAKVAVLGTDSVLASWVVRRAGDPDFLQLEAFQVCRADTE